MSKKPAVALSLGLALLALPLLQPACGSVPDHRTFVLYKAGEQDGGYDSGSSGSGGRGNGGRGNGGKGNGGIGAGGVATDGGAGGSGTGCTACTGLSLPGVGALAACCTATDVCGIDVSSLGVPAPACVEQDAPGTPDANCPDQDLGGALAAGCCRSATSTCGYDLSSSPFASLGLSLGCVDPLEVGGPAGGPCGDAISPSRGSSG